MIKVMIIDDNEALRLGLRIFVEEESDMRVVGEFVSAAVSLSEVEGLKPDVVLLSVGLPDMTGFEACRKILNLLPSTRIVFIGPGHIKQVMIAGMLMPPIGCSSHRPFKRSWRDVSGTRGGRTCAVDRAELQEVRRCGPIVKGGVKTYQVGVDAQRLCPLKCQGKMSSK